MIALRAIVAFLGGWRAAAFAVVAVALAATLWVQSSRLSNAQSEIAGLNAAVATYAGAQTTNLATIDDLREANRRWAAAADARSKRADEAVAAVAAERDALAAELERIRRARRDVYEADPNAASWGRTVVPRVVADQLRH